MEVNWRSMTMKKKMMKKKMVKKKMLKKKMMKTLSVSFFALLASIVVPSLALGAENLSIVKILFADDIAGLGQYTPRPDTRFTLDDVCTVYVEAAGFAMPLATPNTEDSYNVDLALDVQVRLPQSRRKIAYQPDMARLTTQVRSKLPAQMMGFSFTFDGWSPGTYVMEVGLRDLLGGQTVSRDLTLQLAEPTEADIKAKQERAKQEQAKQDREAKEAAPAPR
jgi:hypothetical protein